MGLLMWYNDHTKEREEIMNDEQFLALERMFPSANLVKGQIKFAWWPVENPTSTLRFYIQLHLNRLEIDGILTIEYTVNESATKFFEVYLWGAGNWNCVS